MASASARSSVACRLCYEKFSITHPHRIPRRLVCTHVYCTECVDKLSQLQGPSIECPLCFAITIMPSKGVDYLPKHIDAFGIAEGSKVYEKCKHCIKTTYPPRSATLHCVDCQNFFCGLCSDKMHLQVDNQNHSVRLASSNDDLRLSRNSSALSSKYRKSADNNERSRASSASSVSPICVNHQQYLTMFCQKKQISICSKCKLSPEHRSHDCNAGEKNEDEERSALMELKLELDETIFAYSKVRGNVQKIMEDLKRNNTITNGNIQRYFKEMRNAVNDMEKSILSEVEKIHNTKLNHLKDQCRKMIEVTNAARELSEEADNVMEMDYYQMVVEKKKIEADIINSFENMRDPLPSENAELYVQFPKHEDILVAIKNSPYIVRAPPPPANFVCTLNEGNEVSLSWDTPLNMKYTYLPTLYAVYASTGDDDSFVLLKKAKMKHFTIPVDDPLLCNKPFVQFQVSAINVVAEGKPCFPICIRLVNSRLLED